MFLLIEQNMKVDELMLADIGPKFENHEVFPARTNTGLDLFVCGNAIYLFFWEQLDLAYC